MNKKDRLLDVFERLRYEKAISTKKEFAERIGFDKTNLSSAFGGSEKYLTDNLFNKIADAFPQFDRVWLLTGEGEMLKTHRNGVIEIMPEAIHEGDYSGTLVYDIDVVCGTDTRNIEFTEDRIIGSVKLPEIRHSSHIITATGDSMEPVIRNGDRIAIREIGSWEMIVYGQIYMVLTDEYRLLKYLRRHKADPENMIILRSANPDYDDIDLKRSKIRKLFVVENVIAVKNIL